MKFCRLALLLFLSATLFAGCASIDQDKFAEQVKGWVPLGTSVTQAKKIMEAKGFDCSIVKKDNPFNNTGSDFLECEKEAQFLHSWDVQFFVTNDKISGYGPVTVESQR